MANLFLFNHEQAMSFFAVLIRFSVLMVVFPIVGDRLVPGQIKVFFALILAIVLYPAIVRSGYINPKDALVWGAGLDGIFNVVLMEVLFGLALGFTARIAFDSIHFGANLAGTFMGFAAATTYDPHQETQTQLISEFQIALAMILFLAIDGHHFMLRAGLDSYKYVGVGKVVLGGTFSDQLIKITTEVLRFGFQLAAPVALSIFAVNIVFGVIAKSMPQVNILILSFAITLLVGFSVLVISMPEFMGMLKSLFERMNTWLRTMLLALGQA